jgi:hypothetical protein
MSKTLLPLSALFRNCISVLLWLPCWSVLAQENAAMSGRPITKISTELCDAMELHKVMSRGAPVSCARLAQVRFNYVGFDGQLKHDGRIVVMDAVAPYVLQIFDTLQSENFPIAKARLMNDYDGDDEASTADNNTSAYDDRLIVGNPSVSMHAFGLAIDINPIQNPYIKRQGKLRTISPKAGSKYTNRKNLRPGMAETIVDVFADNGFVVWGGLWRNPIDYQHFQVTRDLAIELARTSPENGKFVFGRYVERYRRCISARSMARLSCIGAVRP